MDACCVLQTVCWINGEPRADLVRCFGTKHQRVVRSTAPHLSPSLAMRVGDVEGSDAKRDDKRDDEKRGPPALASGSPRDGAKNAPSMSEW